MITGHVVPTLFLRSWQRRFTQSCFVAVYCRFLIFVNCKCNKQLAIQTQTLYLESIETSSLLVEEKIFKIVCVKLICRDFHCLRDFEFMCLYIAPLSVGSASNWSKLSRLITVFKFFLHGNTDWFSTDRTTEPVFRPTSSCWWCKSRLFLSLLGSYDNVGLRSASHRISTVDDGAQTRSSSGADQSTIWTHKDSYLRIYVQTLWQMVAIH